MVLNHSWFTKLFRMVIFHFATYVEISVPPKFPLRHPGFTPSSKSTKMQKLKHLENSSVKRCHNVSGA